MLRTRYTVRVLALVLLIYGLRGVRRQYLFQQYIRQQQITSYDFPTPYIKVLNESVARHEQPPLDFNYNSTFIEPQIPRVIHFIWFQNLYPTHEGASQIPTSSSRAPELCREFNPSYEIRLWNATSAREFLSSEYAWFLPVYDGYRYPIQRIDALKYFVLYHYGGVYMDLDISCRRPLDPLLSFAAWFPEASPLGVNNDLMAARAKHPIVERMTTQLERHDKNWLFPYLTIFYSTGPQFTSDILKEWVEHVREIESRTGLKTPNADSFSILPQIYYSETHTFFGHSPGGTWHGTDVAVVLWIVEKPYALIGILVVAAAVGVKMGRQRLRRMSLNRRGKEMDAV
ncbi:nucleotide-diphospho-sugar transferase [Phaeosphaeriaceae sp. PMI808]|nr:nucleotide-diphospho-sugar transferase [Phaeosphaeriaceae sp. PMI808]